MVKQKLILVASATPSAQLTVEAAINNGVASIRIFDRISEHSESSSASIRAKVDEYVAQGITEANLYLNCKGGSTIEATEIIHDLKRFPKLNITVGALAASATTRILAEFKGTAKAYKTSQFMIHRPKMGTYGDVKQIQSDLKLLENTTEDYKTAYSACSGKTIEEIDEYWSGGDVWMTAEQAKAFGLIGEILTDTYNVKAEDVLILEACGAPVIPTIEKKPETNKTMDRDKLISMLGLSADATDEQIEAAFKTNKEKADNAATAQATAEAQLDAKAEALVDGAIAKKKLTADKKPTWLGLAKADYEGTKAALEDMPEIGKISEQLGGGASKTTEAARKDWDLEKYLENDPEAYEKMKVEQPEAAAELEKAYFGKQ